MYQVEGSSQVIKSRKALDFGRLRQLRVSRTVLFLGLTSMLTDVSSEMITTVLPIYLIFSLRLAPLEFGLIDGLYQGGAALVRLASGLISDRWRRYKEVALAGYGLSAVVKLGFLLVGGAWGAIAALTMIDRTGKGIRTAPRDALISLSTPQSELGTAFGVHRAMDTAGAMLGPLIAFALMALVPGAFDHIFIVSFCFALLGLSVLALFVQNRAPVEPAPASPKVGMADFAALLRIPRFRLIVLAGALLSLTTISDGFLYLGMQQRLDFAVGYFPLLYVITALVYMALAVPMGWLADRVGRLQVFIGGYLLLLIVYTSLLLPTFGLPQLLIYLVLFGAYYSATDGVLMALASAYLPEQTRASGLSLLATVTGLGRLLASVLFGLFWTWWGVEASIRTVIVLLAGSLIAACLVFRMTRKEDGRE